MSIVHFYSPNSDARQLIIIRQNVAKFDTLQTLTVIVNDFIQQFYNKQVKHSNQTEQNINNCKCLIVDNQSLAIDTLRLANQSVNLSCQWHCCSVHQLVHQLGTSYNFVVYFCSNGLNLNALEIGAGMISTSGLLVMYVDDELDDSYFMQRFKALATTIYPIARHGNTWDSLQQQSCHANNLLCTSPVEKLPEREFVSYETVYGHVKQFLQTEYFAHITNSSNVNSRNIKHSNVQVNTIKSILPFVISITAKRGRGKSTLVGNVLAELSNAIGQFALDLIYLTAINRQQVCQLQASYRRMTMWQESCPAYYELQSLIHLIETNQFNSNSLLIVEEAASLPVQQLQQLIGSTNYCVLLTTNEGYEGSGNGFNLQLLPALRQRVVANRLRLLELQLYHPQRFISNDNLELLFDMAMGNDWQLNEIAETSVQLEQCHVQVCKMSGLLGQEAKIEQIGSLLKLAHYQTSSNDLLGLWDNPNHLILTLVHQDKYSMNIIGVIWIDLEEVIEKNLQMQVAKGNRRLRGNRISQTLMYDCGLLVNQKIARIVRIVIHPTVQNKGFGTYLVQKTAMLLSESYAIEMLGASFAMEQKVIKFWLNLGYQAIKIGYRVDSASGKISGIFCKTIAQASDFSAHIYNKPNPFTSYKSVDLVHFFLTMKQLTYTAVTQTRGQFDDYVGCASLDKHIIAIDLLSRLTIKLPVWMAWIIKIDSSECLSSNNVNMKLAQQLNERLQLFIDSKRPFYLDIWLILLFFCFWFGSVVEASTSLNNLFYLLQKNNIMQQCYTFKLLTSKSSSKSSLLEFKQELNKIINC